MKKNNLDLWGWLRGWEGCARCQEGRSALKNPLPSLCFFFGRVGVVADSRLTRSKSLSKLRGAFALVSLSKYIRYFDILAEDPRVLRVGVISRQTTKENVEENNAREKQVLTGKGQWVEVSVCVLMWVSVNALCVRVRTVCACEHKCACVCEHMYVYTRGGKRRWQGEGGEKNSPCDHRHRNSCFDFRLRLHIPWGRSPVGSESGKWPYLVFCLDERKSSFAQGNSPWGVPLCGWLGTQRPRVQDPLQIQFCMRNQCGFILLFCCCCSFLQALRCQDPQADNNDAFQTRLQTA